MPNRLPSVGRLVPFQEGRIWAVVVVEVVDVIIRKKRKKSGRFFLINRHRNMLIEVCGRNHQNVFQCLPTYLNLLGGPFKRPSYTYIITIMYINLLSLVVNCRYISHNFIRFILCRSLKTFDFLVCSYLKVICTIQDNINIIVFKAETKIKEITLNCNDAFRKKKTGFSNLNLNSIGITTSSYLLYFTFIYERPDYGFRSLAVFQFNTTCNEFNINLILGQVIEL